MRIRCINAGNFANLTLEQEYEIIRETRDLYTILNDVGIEANYHKKFFAVVAEQPARPATPPPPPPLAPLGVRIVNNGNSTINVFVSTGPTNNRQERSTSLTGQNIAGNCGTVGFDGINGVMSSFCRVNNGYYYNEQNIETIINAILEQCNLAITVFSTNNSYPPLWDVLDRMCDFCSETRNNPNSDNDIKLWGFYTVEE